ncbi:MmgE/PrpD family protein [Methylobacterium nodulans]|uniref:MmgE/PrpD family protein n=1 Tax=Methylobacterium nodulans (strain LMG 21967 / CNCM I-2342 / ORS 2060) TaxID=460265 RepID=B8IWR0_METNO|nr:MmgE/PrpD family protein [Methylobacterium nodulans]ACL62951.1 MmgE/PrpD family protein [Methylobacterium nodulans ORS 2060]
MKARRDAGLRARTAEAARALAAWAAEAVRGDLPDAVRDRAALILADDLGAMVAAADEPPVARMRAVLARSSGVPEATVFAPGAPRLDRASAASANGLAATWCELDEGYRGAPCHAGAYVLPALLAEAEARSETVSAVLAALAVSYEIAVRCARAFPFETMTVHPHAAFATIGAAAGIGLIRGFDAERLLDAVSAAATMAFAGPYDHAIEGALVRNAWTSAGAWIGLRAADGAEAGIAGLPESFYDVFAGAFGTGCVPQALAEGLGTDWAVLGGYHKVFACCQYAHAAIEATLALRQRFAGCRPEEIEEIVVETHPRGLTLTNVEPATVLAAKFSMPHAVAASAITGTGGQGAFDQRTLDDPQIAALRRRVRLEALPEIGPPPHDRPSRVTWRLRDGAWLTELCESARGGADQPFDTGTMLEKLRETTRGFPRMASCLGAIVQGGRGAAPWRDCVAEMTSEVVR